VPGVSFRMKHFQRLDCLPHRSTHAPPDQRPSSRFDESRGSIWVIAKIA
jgi:hypothetical protein